MLPGRIFFTSSLSSASQASLRCRRRIGSSPPSSAVTALSWSPQASAASAASLFFTGRRALPRAVRTVTAAQTAAASRPRSGTGTKNETACSSAAAPKPAARPAAAPRTRRFRRSRARTGRSAFNTSFICLLYPFFIVLFPRRISREAIPSSTREMISIPPAQTSAMKIQPARSAMSQVA